MHVCVQNLLRYTVQTLRDVGPLVGPLYHRLCSEHQEIVQDRLGCRNVGGRRQGVVSELELKSEKRCLSRAESLHVYYLPSIALVACVDGERCFSAGVYWSPWPTLRARVLISVPIDMFKAILAMKTVHIRTTLVLNVL
jgi:hypothetical protein